MELDGVYRVTMDRALPSSNRRTLHISSRKSVVRPQRRIISAQLLVELDTRYQGCEIVDLRVLVKGEDVRDMSSRNKSWMAFDDNFFSLAFCVMKRERERERAGESLETSKHIGFDRSMDPLAR